MLDEKIRALPKRDQTALRKRYGSISLEPDKIKFVDRLVADSRDVALNHTAGLSTPQQVQMAFFSLFTLLDAGDSYTKRCREIVHERFKKLVEGLGVKIPEDPHRVGYYAELDLEVWGKAAVGEDFVEYDREPPRPGGARARARAALGHRAPERERVRRPALVRARLAREPRQRGLRGHRQEPAGYRWKPPWRTGESWARK